MAKKNMLTEANFMGGLFGSSATVPWEGKDFEDNVNDAGKAIATGADGSHIFVEGGRNLSTYGGMGDFNTSTQVSRIRNYRRMQYYPEVDEAIDNVVNDLISNEDDRIPIELNFKRLEEKGVVGEKTMEKMSEAHDKIIRLLEIDKYPYEIMRKFYVDGKRAYQVILSEKPKQDGIGRLVELEAASIHKVKMIKINADKTGIEYVEKERDAYLYDSKTFLSTGARMHTVNVNQNKILELPFESIAYADSGMFTVDGRGVVGFLEPAVKPANNLSTIEDSTIIYSITRAIDKRAVFVDVGDLPTKAAESVVKKTMEKFKVKLNYNQATGEVDANKNQISMVEDYYLARRDGKNVADIQTLDAGRNFGEVNHVQYFKEKVYVALKIPRSRARDEGSVVNIGGSDLAETSRSEYKFGNHIKKIRKRFTPVLEHCLRIELIQTGVCTEKEWLENIKPFLAYTFVTDNYIVEQQETETLRSRLALMEEIAPYVGKVFSIDTVLREILKRSDEEIKNEENKIRDEEKEGLYDDYGETPLQMLSRDERLEQEQGGEFENDLTDEVSDGDLNKQNDNF